MHANYDCIIRNSCSAQTHKQYSKMSQLIAFTFLSSIRRFDLSAARCVPCSKPICVIFEKCLLKFEDKVLAVTTLFCTRLESLIAWDSDSTGVPTLEYAL